MRKLGTKSLAVTRFQAGTRAIPIPLEPFKDGHQIDFTERSFLEAVERGDMQCMVRIINEHHSGTAQLNVNCTNMMGRTAIQIAVDNENVEIVEYLLQQPRIIIGDAILYAIQEGNYIIVEKLINHKSITKDMLGTAWSKSKTAENESADFSPDISPVILAATCNQFEILQLLISRGAKIDKPHQLSCSCLRCRERSQADSLRYSLHRANTYR